MYNLHACVCVHICLFLHLYATSGIESRSSHMLGVCSTTGLVPKLRKYLLNSLLSSNNHDYTPL